MLVVSCSTILDNHQEITLGESAPDTGTGAADGIAGRDTLVHHCLHQPPRAHLFLQMGLLNTDDTHNAQQRAVSLSLSLSDVSL